MILGVHKSTSLPLQLSVINKIDYNRVITSFFGILQAAKKASSKSMRNLRKY